MKTAKYTAIFMCWGLECRTEPEEDYEKLLRWCAVCFSRGLNDPTKIVTENGSEVMSEDNLYKYLMENT